MPRTMQGLYRCHVNGQTQISPPPPMGYCTPRTEGELPSVQGLDRRDARYQSPPLPMETIFRGSGGFRLSARQQPIRSLLKKRMSCSDNLAGRSQCREAMYYHVSGPQRGVGRRPGPRSLNHCGDQVPMCCPGDQTYFGGAEQSIRMKRQQTVRPWWIFTTAILQHRIRISHAGIVVLNPSLKATTWQVPTPIGLITVLLSGRSSNTIGLIWELRVRIHWRFIGTDTKWIMPSVWPLVTSGHDGRTKVPLGPWKRPA